MYKRQNLVFFIHNKTNLSRNTIQLVGEARLLIIYFANIIAWIYLSQFIPKAINIIKAFGLRGLRPYAFDSSLGFGTTKQLLIVQWIVYSIFVATVLIAMIYSVMRKKHLLLNIFAVIDVALYTFLFGGRYLIVRMLMFYLFAFLIVKSLELEKLKVKNLNFVLIGILIIMTIILTNLRNWGNTSFIENVVIYYTGSFTFLDVILSEFDWTTSPLFGTGMFGFIINFIHALFALIFEVPYNSSSCQVITHFTGIPRFISVSYTHLDVYKRQDPDIIHLHNIHGYYINIKVLFDYLKKSGKPVIWTLHDCWSFTGHCAYFDYAGCNKWTTGCHNCPEKSSYPASIFFDNSRVNYQMKKEIFTGVKDLTIVTPSKWLANLVKQSYLKEYPVKVINNGIDLEVFKPTQSDFRKKYNLENKFIILGVANVCLLYTSRCV